MPASGFDPKNVNPLDWGIMGIGFLVLIFSFVSYYVGKVTTSGNCFGFSGGSQGSENAWHGFFGWFAAVVALAAAAAVALEIFAPQVKLPVPNRLAALGLFALATLCILLAFFIHPGTGQAVSQSFGGCKISAKVGHGFGYWVSFLLIIGGLVLSLMRFQAKGGKLPGALGNIPNIGGHGPQ